MRCRQSKASEVTKPSLLSIPAELRNRIFMLVLRGHTTHVLWVPSRKTLSRPRAADRQTYRSVAVCGTGTNDTELAKAIRYATHTREVDTYSNCHAQCRRGEFLGSCSKTQSFLSILQTCSQVHREAAMLPLEHNVFDIANWTTLNQFALRLMPLQRKALKSLSFHHGATASSTRGSARGLESMTGLKHVLIFKEISTLDHHHILQYGMLIGQWLPWHLTVALKPFALESATFVTYVTEQVEEKAPRGNEDVRELRNPNADTGMGFEPQRRRTKGFAYPETYTQLSEVLERKLLYNKRT